MIRADAPMVPLVYVECDIREGETLRQYRGRLERERASWEAGGMRRRLSDPDTQGVVIGLTLMVIIPGILLAAFILTGWTP